MRLIKSAILSGLIATLPVLLLLEGCGGGKTGPGAQGPGATPSRPGGGTIVNNSAMTKFNAAIDSLTAHDKANDWNDATCAEVAGKFEDAVNEQDNKKFPEATYDAGLAYQRCGKDAEAKARFDKALAAEPKFHYARAQLALYAFKETGNADVAIQSLQQSVTDANFQNVPALVDLAMFQMLRDSPQVGQNCTAKVAGRDVDLQDFECAKLNLQRALAIDDSYMPAFNQLALYYFTGAKKRAGSVKASTGGARFGRQIATNAAMQKRADVQQLELAALVCSQAIRKNASYAPIYNTAGLIFNELGQVNGAVKYFQTASELDPRFFEAHMNVGAVNLSFRGFDKAEGAYRKALEMHPNDYDAHLGLALALRGQIDDSNYDKQVAAVQDQLDTCKKLDDKRPDAYFNEGILTQEYKAKSGGDKDKTIASLNSAKTIFNSFIEKASGKPEYDGAAKKAKERIQDIDDTIAFLNAGLPPQPGPSAAPSGSAAPAPAGGNAAPPAAK